MKKLIDYIKRENAKKFLLDVFFNSILIYLIITDGWIYLCVFLTSFVGTLIWRNYKNGSN